MSIVHLCAPPVCVGMCVYPHAYQHCPYLSQSVRDSTPVLPIPARLLVLLPVSKALLTTPCTRPASTARRSFLPRLAEIHPAVAGWPDKYSGTLGGPKGPRILHDAFAVQTGDTSLLMELDVANWPTWTTAGNERWLENVTRKDKEMPYGELSYLISGKLEIVPKATGVPVIVSPGDFVTFPEGFVSDWTVLEELTWHYFLY